jgi:hypothetical protein
LPSLLPGAAGMLPVVKTTGGTVTTIGPAVQRSLEGDRGPGVRMWDVWPRVSVWGGRWSMSGVVVTGGYAAGPLTDWSIAALPQAGVGRTGDQLTNPI